LRGKTTLRDQAEFIAPLLWHDTQPFHLIGHSFGGALALATALAWPDRVKSLTLYEPTAFSLLRGGEDRELYETITRVPARMRLLRDAESPERAIGHFVDFWTGKPVWDERPAAERAQFSRLADKVIDDFRLLFEASFEDLAAIRCPVLVLRGDETVPVAARVAEIVAARIGHARLKTISGAGHMAPVTDPGPIAAAIISHIRTAGTRAGRSEHSAQHELQHGR
jgi:pimeloyl-ACP methyl ester carboxylesterase